MNYFEKMVREYKKKGLPELNILDKKIPHQWNTYSGIKRIHTKCVTFHNSGIDGVSAWGSHHWIKNYSKDNQDKISWAGHIDYDGSIWQLAEWDDLVWASGTYSQYYTSLAVGEYNSKPYNYDIPFEFATINNTGQNDFCGHINDDQLISAALLGAKLCLQFGLKLPSNGGFRRHFDFAKNKPYCPKYLIDTDNWSKFIRMGDDFYDLLSK